MKTLFSNGARFFGTVAAVSAACTLALTISVPYRIHQDIYTWYLWTERLAPFTGLASLVAMVFALVLGIRSRQGLPIALAALSLVLLLVCIGHGGIHSGPNPQAWCYNNLRKIEGAKFQLASENNLSNGAIITGGQISKYIDGGFDTLECAEHGNYSMGALGTESRCSVHGSMSEMERGWEKEMHQ